MIDLARRVFLSQASLCLALLAPHHAQADLAEVVAHAKRSVVAVGTYSATDNPRFNFKGSAFVVGDGLTVITNAHVVGDMPVSAGPAPTVAPAGSAAPVPPINLTGGRAAAPAPTQASGQLAEAQVAVLVPSAQDSGRFRLARLVALDRNRDLAVLRIEGAPLPALILENAPPREGQSIALIGFPVGGVLGFAPVTHRGIVSAFSSLMPPVATSAQLDPRAVARLRDGNFEVLQLDATTHAGNSGGPVLDSTTGRVLGVVNMVLGKESRDSALGNLAGIGYAMPVKQVQALLAEGRTGR